MVEMEQRANVLQIKIIDSLMGVYYTWILYLIINIPYFTSWPINVKVFPSRMINT